LERQPSIKVQPERKDRGSGSGAIRCPSRFNQRERILEVGAAVIRCPSWFNQRERIQEVGAAAIRCPSRFN